MQLQNKFRGKKSDTKYIATTTKNNWLNQTLVLDNNGHTNNIKSTADEEQPRSKSERDSHSVNDYCVVCETDGKSD